MFYPESPSSICIYSSFSLDLGVISSSQRTAKDFRSSDGETNKMIILLAFSSIHGNKATPEIDFVDFLISTSIGIRRIFFFLRVIIVIPRSVAEKLVDIITD